MFEHTAVREKSVEGFELEGVRGGESPFALFGRSDDLIFFARAGRGRTFAVAALRGRRLLSGFGGGRRRGWLLDGAEGEFEIEACAGIVWIFLKCASVIACGGAVAAFLKEKVTEVIEQPRLKLGIDGGFGLPIGIKGLVGLSESLEDQALVVKERGMRADGLFGLLEKLKGFWEFALLKKAVGAGKPALVIL